MIEECPFCDEDFTAFKHHCLDLVMNAWHGSLAVRCPECEELIDVKINEEGYVEIT